MSRARIPPGTVGPVTVAPVGYEASDDDKREVAIPRLTGPSGERIPFPKAMKVGSSIKVDVEDGAHEYVVSRWRGLARAIDTDGSEYIVRRWRETKAAAEHATWAAGEAKLGELQRARAAALEAEEPDRHGDRITTVADLVRRALDSPDMQRRAPGTRAAYGYAANHIIEDPIGAMLPRNVDVATVRRFLVDCATNYGTGGAKHAARCSPEPWTSPWRPATCEPHSTPPARPVTRSRGTRFATPALTTRRLRPTTRLPRSCRG